MLQKYRIIPIVCIGESLQQREAGEAEEVIEIQLLATLQDVQISNNLAIAYEPIWAIGTGETATPQQAQKIHSFIRKWIQENYNKEIANSVPILYGGSVKPENISDLLAEEDIDGGLIGGASLDSNKFKKMIDIAEK
jgi:triosephosphate isomerase